MSPGFPLVTCSVRDGIARITLANPPVNALSRALLLQLREVLGAIAVDEGVRCVVLASAGTGVFVAGGDIEELEAMLGDPQAASDHVDLTDDVWTRLRSIDAPTIAVLHGDAVGGGCELALACDIVIASDRVRVGFPESRLGLIPGAGGTVVLPRLVGPLRAAELMFSGRLLPAREAEAIGMITRVVAAEALNDAVERLSRQLADGSPESNSAIKRLVALGPDAHSRLAAERAEFIAILASANAREGCRAFFEHRVPAFQPRQTGGHQ